MLFGRYTAVLASAFLATETVAKPLSNHSGRLRGSRPGQREDLSKNKYFYEPGSDQELGHYDVRYFHGIVSYDERTDTQLHMIRAYLKFFRDHGLDTWIAHGTLLGWWWNGKRLPWDWDLDTQVSVDTLHHLGEKFNQTRQQYVSDDGKTSREYLIDINPWIWERERGDGMNIIDARWIDVRNGLFIDITGLSETHPDQSPGVWSCKNYHRYHTNDLYPMRESMFEGVPAKIPYAYDQILINEYQEKALVLTEYQGHQWDPNVKAWVKTEAQIESDRIFDEERERQKQEAEVKAQENLELQEQEEQNRKEKESKEDKSTEARGSDAKRRDALPERMGM